MTPEAADFWERTYPALSKDPKSKPPTRSDVQITNGRLDMCRNAVPIELWVKIGKIGSRGVAKLPIHSDLLELIVQRISFAQIMRIA